MLPFAANNATDVRLCPWGMNGWMARFRDIVDGLSMEITWHILIWVLFVCTYELMNKRETMMLLGIKSSIEKWRLNLERGGTLKRI